MDDAAVRARHPRRPPVRPRRLRRQGQLPAAAARRLRAGRRRRAAGQRARADRGRRGDRLRRRQPLGRGRRARRRLRDRLRRRDARPRHARADGRDARDGVREPGGPHRRAARALRPLRRRGAERLPRPARRASAVLPGPTAACRRSCAPGSSRPRRRSSRRGTRCRTAPACSPRRARGPPTDRRPSSTRARWPTRLDVHRIAGGEARTIVPPVASCDLSVRDRARARTRGDRRRARGAAARRPPRGAELEGPRRPSPRPRCSTRARRCGSPRRAGPRLRPRAVLPALRAARCRSWRRSPTRGIPAIVSGFGLPEDNFHAPDESFTPRRPELGRRAARALYEDLGAGLARGA